jgi:peptidoglycan hydrolase CwlO-like protein
MRKVVLMLAALIGMSVAAPTFAEMTPAKKDECLLVSRNCKNAVDDIQTQIVKIDNEIKKGTKVYTPEELQKLERKLAEVKEVLKDLERH